MSEQLLNYIDRQWGHEVHGAVEAAVTRRMRAGAWDRDAAVVEEAAKLGYDVDPQAIFE